MRENGQVVENIEGNRRCHFRVPRPDGLSEEEEIPRSDVGQEWLMVFRGSSCEIQLASLPSQFVECETLYFSLLPQTAARPGYNICALPRRFPCPALPPTRMGGCLVLPPFEDSCV